MELFLCGCEHIRTIPNACVEYHYILTTMYFLIGTHVLGHIHIHVYPSCFVVYLLLSRSESPKMLLFQRVGGVYHSPSQWNQKTHEKGNKYKIERNNLLFLGRNHRWKQCITILVRVREELCTHKDYAWPIESTRIHNANHMSDAYISLTQQAFIVHVCGDHFGNTCELGHLQLCRQISSMQDLTLSLVIVGQLNVVGYRNITSSVSKWLPCLCDEKKLLYLKSHDEDCNHPQT